MNDSNPYITIAFSIAVYAVFAWFLGSRFLRSFIKHSLEPAAFVFVIFPILAMPGFTIFLSVMYLIGITDRILEFAIAFGVLTAVLGILVVTTQEKLLTIIKYLPFTVFILPGVVRHYFAEFFYRVNRSSNSVIFVLKEKTAKEAVEVFFSNFNDETKDFAFVSIIFLGFVVFFLNITSELWPISNFIYWNWYLKYSNFQKFIGNLIFGFLLFFLFYVAHRQRLKAVFNDLVLVLKVAQKNGRYFLVKGRGEIVEHSMHVGEFKNISSMSSQSPIFFEIDGALCLLLDSRVDFTDFLILMRSLKREGVETFAERFGVSVSSFDID